MNTSADRTRYKELVQAYVRAFNAKKLDDIAKLLSEDVTLSDWNLHVKDKSAVYEAMRGILFDGPTLRRPCFKRSVKVVALSPIYP